MSIETMKLALEALECSRVFVTTKEKIKHPEGTEWYDEAITALRQALANEALDRMAENARELRLDYEPADEPVAWVCYGISSDEKHCLDYEQSEIDAVPVGTMLYTRPQPAAQWVGLTDEERRDALVSVDAETKRLPPGFRDFARAIEQALKEKNR